MARFNHLSCCGIKELPGIGVGSSPADALWGAGLSSYQPPTMASCKFVIFSQATPVGKNDHGDPIVPTTGYGFNFAQFIREQDLGDVVELRGGINPNSSNYLNIWMWEVDMKASQAWFEAEIKRRGWKPTGTGYGAVTVASVGPEVGQLDPPPAGANPAPAIVVPDVRHVPISRLEEVYRGLLRREFRGDR